MPIFVPLRTALATAACLFGLLLSGCGPQEFARVCLGDYDCMVRLSNERKAMFLGLGLGLPLMAAGAAATGGAMGAAGIAPSRGYTVITTQGRTTCYAYTASVVCY